MSTNEPGDDRVERGVIDRQCACIANAKFRAAVGHMCARVRHETVRLVDAEDFRRSAGCENALAQRPGAAADIEPGLAGRDCNPFQEVSRDKAAPPPDILFVAGAQRPGVMAGCVCHGRSAG